MTRVPGTSASGGRPLAEPFRPVATPTWSQDKGALYGHALEAPCAALSDARQHAVVMTVGAR